VAYDSNAIVVEDCECVIMELGTSNSLLLKAQKNESAGRDIYNMRSSQKRTKDAAIASRESQ